MRVLVTGASGFLGRATVDALLTRGMHVVAMVRPSADTDRLGWPASSVTVVRGDLRQSGPWVDEVRGVDAVVHLAAAPSGGLSEQFAGTVLATENLLAALDIGANDRFVHVSSLSVYDFAAPPTRGRLDELTVLESHPRERDAYTTTKLEQERLVRDAIPSARLVVIRPGAIYGPGKEWGHGVAMRIGPLALIASPHASMRLTYVANCAEALAAAVDAPRAAGRTVNVIDDDRPTHREFFDACRAAGATDGWAVDVPWWAVSGLGRAIRLVDRLLLRGTARLPEVLAHRRQVARWRPLSYPNAVARELLDWSPRVGLEQGIAAMIAGRDR